MDDTKYLFIDGGYVQRIHRSAMEAVFGVAGDLSIQKIVNDVDPFRTYYYDCVEETPKDSESQSDFEERVAPRNAYLAQIQSLPGVHVRLGTLSGRHRKQKEPRQKEVDVLIAVDMLTHGFNRNMRRAALLAGDLDFRPVVEALVQGGVFVEVWYEKTSGSKDLYWAADQGRPIDWHLLHKWNTDAFRRDHQTPDLSTSSVNHFANCPQVGRGSYEGRHVEMMRESDRGAFVLWAVLADGPHWLKHPDRQVLERYFTIMHGPITWNSLREG
jgi:uncharacterized LabA/DUF88 family protein